MNQPNGNSPNGHGTAAGNGNGNGHHPRSLPVDWEHLARATARYWYCQTVWTWENTTMPPASMNTPAIAIALGPNLSTK